MEDCCSCNERWFQIVLDRATNICRQCRKTRDAKTGDNEPYLMSAENNMSSGPMPLHLPELTQVEEMLIASTHVVVQMRHM